MIDIIVRVYDFADFLLSRDFPGKTLNFREILKILHKMENQY